jgi:hypothetical protein
VRREAPKRPVEQKKHAPIDGDLAKLGSKEEVR